MPNAITTGSPIAQQQAIGKLMYHAAVGLESDFEKNGTFAFPTDVPSVFRTYFNYTCGNYEAKSIYTSSQWYNKIAADINVNKPIFYAFWQADNSGGHAVVCDGYQNGNEIHLNLGWSGSYNAWYNIDSVSAGGYTWTIHGAVFGITPPGSGTAPANDSCSGAITLSSGVTNSLNTANATSTGDPTPNCGSGAGKGVWFKVTPVANGTVSVTTCGSGFDTVLAIYSGSCGSLTSVTCDDDGGCGGNTSLTTFSGIAGTTYYLLAGGYSGASGNLKIAAILPTPPAPSNDICSGAIALANGGSAAMNTAYATSTGDPTPSCGSSVGKGVWYKVTPTSSGTVTLNTCGSSYDTVLAIYSGSCGSLSAVTCNDDDSSCGSGSTASQVTFTGNAGTTYYIFIGGYYGVSGNLQIFAQWSVSPPPSNDQCSGAVTLTSGVTNSLNTAYATSTSDPTPSCGSSVGKGVWYKVTPTASGSVTVSTCGSSYDTVLAIYSGSCGSLTSVTCDDDSGCGGNTSLTTFSGTAGTTYYILAGGYSEASGNLKISAILPFVKATATVTLGSLSQIYNGTARSATATTSPTGLAVDFTYNGSPNAPTNAGSYTVIGTINNLNYQGSATNTLVVILPTITTQPLSQTVNAGDTATFSVGVTGTGAQFQWRFNGTDLVGKTSSTLILNSIGTNQAGIYLVLVTVGTVSLLSDPAELVVPLPGQPGSKKWQFTYGGAIDTTPALAKDGTVYVAADSALIALNPSGSQKWTLSLPGLLYASPTVAADGTIYVGAWWFTTLYAVNPNGTLRWQTNLPGWSSTYSQSIADDGTIIVSLGGELTSTRVYALDTNGTPKWSFDAGGRPSGAAIAYDGTIYIGNEDTNQFFALHPDGSAKWNFMGIYNPRTPAIGADGTIYVGGIFDLQFRAFRPDGTMLWQYPTSASVVSTTAAVGTDGTIYIATIWDGKLYALNPDGTLKWVHNLGDRTYIGLAVSKQGTIYTSANEKRFLAINSDGTTQWEFVTGSQDINPNEGRRSSPTIAPDGTIYFPVNQPGIGGVIFAIQGDSGPAESSWPMAYQNAQHTSRVPFAITNQPASQIVLGGSNVIFSVGVASTQPCVFQWRHNGGDLPNQTNATLILPNVVSDAQGVYACLVSNRSGAYVSHNASLTVTTTFTLWITKQGVNVQLSWPVAYSNYTLLGSASLTGGAWITNSSPRTISGSNIFVTLPATNSRMFYRLVMP